MAFSIAPRKIKKVAELVWDPVAFSEHFLLLDLWRKQKDILWSLQTQPRVSVKACHASGKSFLAAAAVLWFVIRHKEAIVLTTAPTWLQVENVLWHEIRKISAGADLKLPKPNATSLHIGNQRYAIGLSPDQGIRLQGYHAENLLLVADEAPGVAPDIWEAVEGIRAGGNVRVLSLGNPILSSGKFYDQFHSERAGWCLHSISAFDTPNLAGIRLRYELDGQEVIQGDPAGRDLLELTDVELDNNVRPYLVTRRWVREKFEEWGPGHALWQTRVLGQFATRPEDALLPLAWLEEAKTRVLPPGQPLQAGIDVAGPGESETTLFVRRGSLVVAQQFWTKADPRGEVIKALMPYKEENIKVKVDTVGIGYNFGLHLRDAGFDVVEVNVGAAARDTEKFANQKAELYWALRQRAQSGDLAGLTDETTIGQLAGIRYRHNARGQVVIEGKEEARKRGVKSPDRAEGLMLAFAETGNFGILEFMAGEVARLKAGPPPIPISPWDAFRRF